MSGQLAVFLNILAFMPFSGSMCSKFPDFYHTLKCHMAVLSGPYRRD